MMGAGALGMMGARISVIAADEATGDAMSDAPVYTTEVYDRPGAGKLWSGPGSASGDWTATPQEIAELGGSTMPLDELNRRRKLYKCKYSIVTTRLNPVCHVLITQGRCGMPACGQCFGDAGHVWGACTTEKADEADLEVVEAHHGGSFRSGGYSVPSGVVRAGGWGRIGLAEPKEGQCADAVASR